MCVIQNKNCLKEFIYYCETEKKLKNTYNIQKLTIKKPL